ncbi:MAG: hypothetical protein HFH41_03905 [Lachnospiraceae bacterium]|nr:hypothetical protein [Lachnospiraceae bacterium]
MMKQIVAKTGILQEEMNRRAQLKERAEILIYQGRYDEACRILDKMNTVEDAEYLSGKGFRPVLHNGTVTEWELESGQA